MTADQVRALIAKRLKKTTQRALAAEWGVSPPFLNDVIKGSREPSGGVLRGLGLRRVVSYQRLDNVP